MKAESLIATSGNHDCDSRFQHCDHDPRGFLQTLDPIYPVADLDSANQYWARNFVSTIRDRCRIVSLNSCAHHGGAPEEIAYGRISSHTLEALRRSLDKTPPEVLANILICHHHPHPHTALHLGEKDTMRSGSELLALLGSGRFGRWIVVHGHKHHPSIEYAQGQGMAPLVISCGSFAACLYPELASNVRNQCHIIALKYSDIPRFGLAGHIYSWEWADGSGWTAATRDAGLPSICGFGFRCDPVQLAAKVAAVAGKKRMRWESIKRKLPEVDLILPTEFDIMRHALENDYKLTMLYADDLPFEVDTLQ